MLRVLLLLLSFTLMTGIVAGDEPRARVGSQSTQRFDPDELLSIADEIEERGPIRLAEVIDAQKLIIATARRMADAGTIMLGGKGNDFV